MEADDKPAWHKGVNDGGTVGERKVERGKVERGRLRRRKKAQEGAQSRRPSGNVYVSVCKFILIMLKALMTCAWGVGK